MILCKEGDFLRGSMAMVIAASSALLLVCRYGYDFISMCVVVLDVVFTSDAPSVGFPFI